MVNGRLATVVAAVVVSMTFLAGCASSSGGGPASSTSAGTSGGGAVQTQAKAKVAEYEKGPASYPGPTEPIMPGTGNAEVLACGNVAPVCQQQSAAAVDALRQMGWNSPPAVDGQLSPQVQGAFMDRAVQNHLDAVILIAVDVNTIKASVERAVGAGVIIMCTQCMSGPQWAGKVYDVTADFHGQGEIAAWKVVADKGEHAKVFGTVDTQFTAAVQKSNGLKDGITANCPACAVQVLPFLTANVAKPGPPEFTAFLASHPNGTVDYVVPHFDGLSTLITTTTHNAGRKDFLIGGMDGSPDGLNKLATANPPMAFDIAEPFTYEEWCAADLIARIKAKAPLWTGYDRMPSTLIDSTNSQRFLSQKPDSFPAPADYQATLLKYWGKS
jgi:ribose transport system substrate-binding protein